MTPIPKIPPAFPPDYDPSNYSYSAAITEIMESLWNEITGLGIGFEGHFVIGGGFDSFYCCDTNERKWRVRTAKICFGAGFGVSGGGNIIPSKSNRSSCPDGLSGFSTEFGAGPVEVGIRYHKGEPVFTPGFGAGIGGKATVCYYKILAKDDIGCCKN